MLIEQTDISTMDNEMIKNEINNKLTKLKVRHAISGFIKRGIDLAAGIVGCFMLVPITLYVVVSNAINKDNGPIFFTQERIGKKGKIFKMYKFRTMVVGAEEILKKHIEEKTEIGQEYIEHKKIKNDPRITKVGRILRATSLEEFPQFINVIKGQMSLVGPRPYLPREKEDMGEYYEYIIKMKPGVTGPWQVAGRSDVEFDERLEMDKEYCDRRGNRRDIKIVFKTIMKVIKKEGAI